MKTTVVLDDKIYELLQDASRLELGSRRRLSQYLNRVLSEFFARKKGRELFGSTQRFQTSGYRDERDRFT